jgi:hypothetical protein
MGWTKTCQNLPRFDIGWNVAGPATPIVDFRQDFKGLQ